ncbi:DUF4974 domain-containing protein [Flavobacteriaceae bacterium F08102]|nr:DUF4974 domain-containing protein [Flavobacteriaceae bacterium F08102]
MTIFDKIYALAEKLAKAIVKGKPLDDLDESTLFNSATKKRVYENLSEDHIQEQLHYLREIDASEEWERLVPYLEPRSHKVRPLVIAIAASLALVVSMSYVWFMKKNHAKGMHNTQVHIEAGKTKATLTLMNGKEVVLEKGTQFQTDNMQSNGVQLVYHPEESLARAMEYNVLTVPRGGEYRLVLSDSTVILLNSESKLKYPVAFRKGEDRKVTLLYGEAYFEVSPSTKHAGSKFRVECQEQVIEVLGTTFNIKAYQEEEYTYTTLVEGKVNVAVGSEVTTLHPGEQSVLTRDTKQLALGTIHTNEVTSWIRGIFVFKDKSLNEIMKVLARWYDVEVEFKTAALAEVEFNGVLSKTQNLEVILNGIKNTNFINAYEINQKTVIIH